MSEAPLGPCCLERLEALRERYNRRELVHPDPLEFLYRFDDVRDREIVGLVASSLAYGNVKAILGSVERALARMPRPAQYLRDVGDDALFEAFRTFRHRVTSGETLARLLVGVKRVLAEHGSLEACFMRGLREGDETVVGALGSFVDAIVLAAGTCPTHLLAVPRRGSTCKRLFLFLRWMVRRDEIDPGGWDAVPASKLVVPLDVHMHRIGLGLGLTRRKHANLLAALEVTANFRTVAPDDPVKYDFALTRLGIRKDADLDAFLAAVTGKHAEVA